MLAESKPELYDIVKYKEAICVSYIPTPEQAEELVKRYNKEAFHIQHAETVSKVMGEFAKEYDPDNVDFWRTVGMLHDIDFVNGNTSRFFRARLADGVLDPLCVEFKARLLDTIEGLIGKGYVHFISGGAMGMIPARYYL